MKQQENEGTISHETQPALTPSHDYGRAAANYDLVAVNYDRIAAAIDFFRSNFKKQPSLEEAAKHVHLSPFHFQRLFREWAGVTPKQFLQYISLGYAKKLLKGPEITLFDTAVETGLSGTGRLHDLFIKLEGMTPAEFRSGGASLVIRYDFADSPFGEIIIAATPRGICYIAFCNDDRVEAVELLRHQFPKATYRQETTPIQQAALQLFQTDGPQRETIRLHVKGTAFQLKVWEMLLKVPVGALTTYSGLAARLDKPSASRAVGSAVADNPVAILIPCHRVIRSTGMIGEYHWGSTRKTAMIGWEIAQTAT